MKRNITYILGALLAAATLSVAIRVTAEDASPMPGMQIYSGILRSIDLQSRTVIVDGSAVPQKFVVPTNAQIIVKDKPKGDLDNLQVGDGVQVKYNDNDDGAHLAHQISLLSLKVP